MQQEDDFSEESMNRDQRRRIKKAKNRRQTPTSQAEKLNAASAVMADTIAGRETPQKVAQPKALEELRKQAQDGREDAIKQLAEMRRGRAAQPPEEAPLVQQMRKVDDSTLFAVENALYYAAITAGALWVVAGLCVAADAFLIATKRPVPPAFDDMLGKYVEPFLTPGLVAVLVFSLALGALQFIKFESGPTSTGKVCRLLLHCQTTSSALARAVPTRHSTEWVCMERESLSRSRAVEGGRWAEP